MSALGSKLRSADGGILLFFCPGCKTAHQVRVSAPAPQSNWGYNGNPDAPTFTPSILVKATKRITDDQHRRIMAGESVTPEPLVCHSFVTDGHIQFLSDCSHELAGQTVPLPNFPGWQG